MGNLDKIITKEHKKDMINFMLNLIRQFPTTAVKESAVDFTENTRILTSGSSARPGPYKFANTPYAREITESLSESSRIVEIAVMKGAQTGITTIMENHQLYCIFHGLGPILYVSSDDDLAGEYMEKRLDVALNASGLRDKITPPVLKRSKKSTGDSRRAKSYSGTFIRAVGSRSESKLSSFPIRYLHLDETDKYPLQLASGGSSIAAAIRRTDSYGNLKKIMYVSTPKNKSTSRIEPLFQQGDMRYYNISCPACGHLQPLKWSQIKWEKDGDNKLKIELDKDGQVTNNPVWHECANKDCKYKMRDYEKIDFMREKGFGGKAEWIPSTRTKKPGLRSYHVSSLYGLRAWTDIVLQWNQIEQNQDLLQSFINDVLGETFEAKVDKPDEHYLAARAESDWRRGDINERVKVLVAGVDVQKDRLEMSLIGFTEKKESWAIEHLVYTGVTADPGDNCYNVLEEDINKDYFRTDGSKIQISIALIDGGYNAPAIISYIPFQIPDL